MTWSVRAATLVVTAVLLAGAGAPAAAGQSPDDRIARALFASAEPAKAVAALGDAVTPAERQQLLDLLADVDRARALDGPPVAADGVAAGPLADAAWAEGYLKARRDSPLAPFLYTWLMARFRQAFEAQAAAADVAGQTASAKKYRAFLQRARGAADPLVVRIASALDAMPFLVRETAFHPRDFNPDT